MKGGPTEKSAALSNVAAFYEARAMEAERQLRTLETDLQRVGYCNKAGECAIFIFPTTRDATLGDDE